VLGFWRVSWSLSGGVPSGFGAHVSAGSGGVGVVRSGSPGRGLAMPERISPTMLDTFRGRVPIISTWQPPPTPTSTPPSRRPSVASSAQRTARPPSTGRRLYSWSVSRHNVPETRDRKKHHDRDEVKGPSTMTTTATEVTFRVTAVCWLSIAGTPLPVTMRHGLSFDEASRLAARTKQRRNYSRVRIVPERTR